MKTKKLLATVLIAALILVNAGCNNQSVTIIPEDGNENKESSIEIIQSESIAETTIKSTTVTPTPIISVSETTVDAKSTNPSNGSTANGDSSDSSSYSDVDENDNTQTGSLPNQEPIEDDSSSGTITNGNNTIATSTPAPTATPIPEPTEEPEPEPTEKEPVAAIVQVTEIVYGSDDPDGEDRDVSVTVVREYIVQPYPDAVYHSYRVSDYIAYDFQADYNDLDNEFYSVYPNGLVAGYNTIGETIVGFVD